MVDFGQFLAGPFGPMLLADLGADVIKVEPTRGDGMRAAVVGSFMGCQRGKRDISLDLKQPEGLEVALRLVATADMVHHNMTKGTADRLGIGYEHCQAVKPDILYCNNFMYGAIGPSPILVGSIHWPKPRAASSGRRGPFWPETLLCGTATDTAMWPRRCHPCWPCSSPSFTERRPVRGSRCGPRCSTGPSSTPLIAG